MPYIKNIQSMVNNADSCGGGMKKAGLVYGSDWNRLPGNYLKTNTPTNLTFTIYGKAVKTCCGR
jgi:hypothetical protein